MIGYINKDLVEYIQDAKKKNFSKNIIEYDVKAYCDHVVSNGGADSNNVFWADPPNEHVLIVELFEKGKMDLIELKCDFLKNKVTTAYDRAMKGI